MSMRLELSRRAQTDLDDIRDYSVEHFGLARAIRYLDAVEAGFRRIVDHPKIGELRQDLTDTVRSLPVGEHRVYYWVGSDTILILRVLHKAMDTAQHL
jgi:toxin ParE1/3/4